MKLGLVGILAICSQLLAVHYYMVSVFILGVDVGKLDETCQEKHLSADVCTKIKTYKEGKFRFRLIVFKSIDGQLPKRKLNEKINWDIYSVNDFDISFSVLEFDIFDQFFSRLWFDPQIVTDFLERKKNYAETVSSSDFKFIVHGAEFNTESTHVASLITDYDITKDIKLSVVPSKRFTIHLKKIKGKVISQPLNFDISEKNVGVLGPCTQAALKTTVKMNSIELTKKNGKGLDKWKDGKYKVVSTITKGTVVKRYVDFKTNIQKRIANIVVVVNHIPLKRFESIYSSYYTSSYDIRFNVESLGDLYDQSQIEDPFDESKPAWETVTKENSHLNKDLFTKWSNAEEIIAVTLHFKCPLTLI